MTELQTIKPELLSLSSEQLSVLMPFFWVFGGAILGILLCVFKGLKPKWPVFLVTSAATVMGMVSAVSLMGRDSMSLFNGMLVADGFVQFLTVLFLGSALLTLFSSFRYLDREKLQHPEYYLLVLFSALGMMLMVSSLDLVVLFISLEIMSLSVYSLVGFRRADRRSNEAALKYFILGGAASAILLYGVALIYGVTATTNLKVILTFAQGGAAGNTLMFAIGSWLVIIGFLFKVASVPFHMWMPDVYEGAPVPVTGFMTTGLKAAAFATFLRVFISMGIGKGFVQSFENHVHDIIWVSALLTMIVGNVVALSQTNLKRILAYSSIAHTGYLLVGLLAGLKSEQGNTALLMYLVAYSLMNMGAFVVLSVLSGPGDEGINLHDLAGISRRRPWMAFAMAVFLFSMAGVPPTAGFVAKYWLFYSAVQAGEIPLVVLAVLCSAVSVFYYLRVLVYMYMREPVGGEPNARVSLWSAVALASMVLLTLQMGILPQKIMEMALKAVSSL